MSEALIIGPALIMGAVIGFIELIFVHADEHGMGWFMHGMHAIPATIIFVFTSMNITFVLNLLNLGITSNMWVNMGVRVIVAIIAMVKIGAAAAIAGKVGEKMIHTVAIGVLIFATPYAWDLFGPAVLPILPTFLR